MPKFSLTVHNDGLRYLDPMPHATRAYRWVNSGTALSRFISLLKG